MVADNPDYPPPRFAPEGHGYQPRQPKARPQGKAPYPSPAEQPILTSAPINKSTVKDVFCRFIDSHPKLAYAFAEWVSSDTRGHFQINRADKNGKYIWSNLISDRE